MEHTTEELRALAEALRQLPTEEADIVVLLYQGSLTALASLLSPIMTAETVAVSVAVGSLSLLGLGMNMLGITKLKVANFLPAMFVPIVYQIIVVLFHLNGVL